MVSMMVELVELRCRCGALMTRVQHGAAYHNTCRKCGTITHGIAGKPPAVPLPRPLPKSC